MTDCNARISVSVGRDATCQQHVDIAGIKYPHGADLEGQRILWDDDAPGATPHQDPTPPTYEAVKVIDDWVVDAVTATDRYAVCEYGGGLHPDPQGAAEAEARRLRCQPHDGDESLHGAWVCDGCGVEVQRDPSISTAEVARYREALRLIAEGKFTTHFAMDYAKSALDGDV